MPSLPIIFILLILALSALALLRSYQVRRSEHDKSIQGLHTLTLLIDIIKFTQQHRGLQAGLLNGQKIPLNALLSLEKKINTHYAALSNNKTKIDKTILRFTHKAQSQWQNILKHPNQDINKSFYQHSSVIQRLLDCLWDLADEFSLTSHSNQNIQNLANDLVRTFPKLSESIGQVRAITLQITNSKYCSADKKLLLLFTLGKIQRELPLIQQKLHSDSYKKLSLFIEEIKISVEDQALGNRNPEAFFADASTHMDVIFHYIQTGLVELKEQISSASRHTQKR
ncbi:hypothetical protein A9Q77_08435 [Marinomonas sp. 42_23_T18]|nr:hypothetical protein A9Q77_08435 [Marinomonas sp. 42_23_T18]